MIRSMHTCTDMRMFTHTHTCVCVDHVFTKSCFLKNIHEPSGLLNRHVAWTCVLDMCMDKYVDAPVAFE